MSEKIYNRNKCPLCGKKGIHVFTTKDRSLGKPGIFYLFHCVSCDIDFIEKPNNLAEFYDETYYTDFTTDISFVFKIKSHIVKNYYEAIENSISKRFYSFLIGFIAALPKKKGRIMDIGCGPGDILYLLSNVGFDVYGLDISEYAVSLAHFHGLNNVSVGMEDKMELYPDEYFDCVRASHVIEHMPDPVNFISTCYKKIVSGGSLIISTPNINSFNRRIFGRYTKCYSDIPRHVILFSNKSLVGILKKTGFKYVKITYKSIFSDFYEGLYNLFDIKFGISKSNIGKRLHRDLVINFILLPVDLILIIFRRGETMTVTAIK